MLRRGELVVERDENAAREEDGIRGNQPLGLIRHDDAGAIASRERSVLQGAGERMSAMLKFLIGETFFFAIAVGFDQACFRGESHERVLQRCAD